MGLEKFRPFTPSRRFMTVLSLDEVTRSKPNRRLTSSLKRTGGRNNQGRITSRWVGGGHKRRYRKIDFLRRDKEGIVGRVVSIEYDPNRSALIALISYVDGEYRYMLAPKDLCVGFEVLAGPEAEIRPGNAMPLKQIPMGTLVHNVELKVGRGGQLIRSAGGSARILARDAGHVALRMPSGEIRKMREECYATIGQLSNLDHENVTIGKAGRSRWLGINPRVRGSAMNPVDHPHGGGEGKSKGGRHPVSPWGMPTKGYKTRQNKRTDKYIVSRRKKKGR